VNLSAVIITGTNPVRAPRIRRQIKWLKLLGFSVTVIGRGEWPESDVPYFRIGSPTLVERYFAYIFLRRQQRFDFLVGSRVPSDCLGAISDAQLVVVNEIDLIPHGPFRDAIMTPQKRVYFDVHEDHLSSLARNILESIAFDSYNSWVRQQFDEFIANRGFENVGFSTVEDSIARKYSKHLGVDFEVIRNSPYFVEIEPHKVDTSRIQLVHHGMGTRSRGIEAAIKSLGSLPDFELHLYLVATNWYLAKLKLLSLFQGVSRRVFLHHPVSTESIPLSISKHDVALVLSPPVTENQLNALPNKFFESIQGRLAIVVGPNPTMSSIVKSCGNGIVLDGWTAKDLVQGLRGIQCDEITRMKNASHGVAYKMSAELDFEVFRRLITPGMET